MRKSSITKFIAVGLVMFVVGLAVGSAAQFFTGPLSSRLLSGIGMPTDPGLAKLVNAYNMVLSRHVQTELDKDAIIEGGIRGLLSKVDGGFTRYENQEEVLRRQETDTGEYAGIGVSVRMVDEQVNIESVFRGSPAQNAGLLARDIIIGVNGEAIRGMLLTDVTDIIKGTPGTDVNLTILRPSQNRTFDVSITRARIIIPLVEYEVFDDGLAHVVLSQFLPNAVEQMRLTLVELNSLGVTDIVLDMRFNGGGYTDVVEKIADFFLPANLVIYQSKDREGKTVQYSTTSPPIFTGNVHVLLNSSSASATEILAGALRDHLGSEILGETSYGKGTVQTGYSLGDGSRVWITTMTYLTPSGTDINKKGIIPDVEILQDFDALPALDTQLRDALEHVRIGMETRP
ncbi:MAG TPA: S41 family peptidase [Bacillota bacterium]|nr:S41 family peptidase [Bacillota bacterium]